VGRPILAQRTLPSVPQLGHLIRVPTVSNPKTRRCILSELVVILNQTRGAEITSRSLREIGAKNLDCDFAYSGATVPEGKNPYAELLRFSWEHPEPSDWTEELRSLFPQEVFHYFLDPENDSGLAGTPYEAGLWTSGLIQVVFRKRALDNIFELGLDKKYSWFFFVRSDFLFINPIPEPTKLGPESLLMMEGESHGAVNDRFLGIPIALLPQAREMANTLFAPSSETLVRMKEFFSRRPIRNPESLLLYSAREAGVFELVQKVGQLGYCVRGPGEGTRGSAGTWSPRQQVFIKYVYELLLSKTGRLFGTVSQPQMLRSGSLLLDHENPSFQLRVISFLANKGFSALILLAIGEFAMALKAATKVWQARAQKPPSPN
jgi:hypothetical protein